MNESAAELGAPQVPQLSGAVLMLRSVGGMVDAAAALATHVVGDLDGRLEPLDPDTRTLMLALCDAVFTADYTFARTERR